MLNIFYIDVEVKDMGDFLCLFYFRKVNKYQGLQGFWNLGLNNFFESVGKGRWIIHLRPVLGSAVHNSGVIQPIGS